MKNFIFYLIIFLAIFSIKVAAQTDTQAAITGAYIAIFTNGTEATTDEEAILETVLNYIEGTYTADGDRVEESLWPEVYKVIPYFLPQTGRYALIRSGYSRIIEAVNGSADRVNDSEKNIEIKIEVVSDNLACVKMTSIMSNEFFHLVKIDDEWKIINVLWTFGPEHPAGAQNSEFNPEDENSGIIEAALNYIDGYFSGDADRMDKGVHPELHKVAPMVHPKTGEIFFDKIGSQALIEFTRTKSGMKDESERNISVNILDVMDGLASVEVLSSAFDDYLQMAKINGDWKIINVLWKPVKSTE